MTKYNVIGVMSGTSMDGLDIALCRFENSGTNWKFKFLKTKTFKYPDKWKKFLLNCFTSTGYELNKSHKIFGSYIGKIILEFLVNTSENIDLISSHGHTIFHQPEKKITFQLGDGLAISEVTGIKTISDFRSTDVALGGQGAPLVPIGDLLLFNEHNICLNLGGFANITIKRHHLKYTKTNLNNTKSIYPNYQELIPEIVAFDICPVNIILNYFVNSQGLEMDKDGIIGQQGKINRSLLQELNDIKYYDQGSPKSLGFEWLMSDFIPKTEKYNIGIPDKLRTIYEHIVFQISKTLNSEEGKKLLVSGGGTFNNFLMFLLKKMIKNEITIPDDQLINFKESLIFALLGVLRLRNEINCLASVTGAERDSVCGTIYS